jgi:diguanylate cyclase (GGDEF)-like protein/PAS domain S-box-containing protein
VSEVANEAVAPQAMTWDGSWRWIDLIPDGVLLVDREGRIQRANRAMATLCGVAPEAMKGLALDSLLPPEQRARHGEHLRSYFAAPRPRPMGGAPLLRLWHREGRAVPVDVSLGLCVYEGRACALAVVRDVSDLQALHDEARRQAMHDPLTGLYSRLMFHELLAQAVEQSLRATSLTALLLIDLDDFKSVNDGHGHHVGDELLKEVARRMRAALRSGDVLARLGGDEFAVLLRDLPDEPAARGVADKLLRGLAQPWRLQHHEMFPGGSIGIVFLPRDGRDGATLLRRADMAMYRAKDAGRGVYAVYDAAMSRAMEEKALLQGRLKRALQGQGLALHYQPLVAARDGRVVGVEALLRWHDAELGEVGPARFIPVAESTGLILPLGDWVLGEACRQIAAWQADGLSLRVAVNVSPLQLRQPDFAARLARLLAETGAPAELLELEITESAAMGSAEHAGAMFRDIAALGVGLSLDDFGVGHSSLGHLRELPFKRLKMDRSFIQRLESEGDDLRLARAIIRLAQALGKDVVAEGVEREGQRRLLAAEGCPVLQGWLFAPALPAAHVPALVRQGFPPG